MRMKKLLVCFLRKLKSLKNNDYDKELDKELKKRGIDLIPAWFTSRMMTDVWGFGLMLENGTVIAIECIDRVIRAKDGSIWLDVRLIDHSYKFSSDERLMDHSDHFTLDDDDVFFAPCSDRPNASINASKIVAAFEIRTS